MNKKYFHFIQKNILFKIEMKLMKWKTALIGLMHKKNDDIFCKMQKLSIDFHVKI